MVRIAGSPASGQSGHSLSSDRGLPDKVFHQDGMEDARHDRITGFGGVEPVRRKRLANQTVVSGERGVKIDVRDVVSLGECRQAFVDLDDGVGRSRWGEAPAHGQQAAQDHIDLLFAGHPDHLFDRRRDLVRRGLRGQVVGADQQHDQGGLEIQRVALESVNGARGSYAP